MASTGIILRRKLGKNLFVGEDVPVPGELVMDLVTTNFGFLDEDGVTIRWGKLEDEIPTGGTTGQVLVKNTNIDGDVAWSDPVSGLPSGGTDGQVLTKDSTVTDGASWMDSSGGGGGELIAVDEGNGIGYVLKDDDRSMKINIGLNAIDLSSKDPISMR